MSGSSETSRHQRLDARRQALERHQRARRGMEEPTASTATPEPAAASPEPVPTLAAIIEPVAQEVIHLAGRRLALLKAEATREATGAGRGAALLAVGVAGLGLGYLLLNAAVALAIGAMWQGLVGVAVTAATLAVLHLIIGGVLAANGARRLKERQPWRLETTRAELKRDVKWLKNIKETPALPEPQVPREP